MRVCDIIVVKRGPIVIHEWGFLVTKESLLFSSDIEWMKHYFLRGPTMKPRVLIITKKDLYLIKLVSKKSKSNVMIQQKTALADIYSVSFGPFADDFMVGKGLLLY
jgi:hypothetical protein